MAPWIKFLSISLFALPVLAWAGKDEAELALTSARANVASAERADAIRYAPQELNTARDMLAQAEGSFDERDWTDAEREAQRAKADGRLAEALSRQRVAGASLHELEATISVLREEIARNGGQS